jgi:hypothetical protein
MALIVCGNFVALWQIYSTSLSVISRGRACHFFFFAFLLFVPSAVGSSRKKSISSSELKNVQATKAARRLARKAEAARQSRRRKKAALSNMEQTLADLEARHAELSAAAAAAAAATQQQQQQQQQHHHSLQHQHLYNDRRGAGGRSTGSLRDSAPSSRPASPRIPLGLGILPPPLPLSSSSSLPTLRSSRSDSASLSTPSSPSGITPIMMRPHSSASASALSSSSPYHQQQRQQQQQQRQLQPGTLSARFQTVLAQLAAIRSEEIHEKIGFLQQHTSQ